MKLSRLTLAIGLALSATTAYANTAEPTQTLKTVTVKADLRESTVQDMPASVQVYDQATLQDQGATHFDDVLLKTPNVNFSGQSSRARHIQIRGMGERDEYTGAPNASVGFAIDDIDFSGIGMVSNLFDVKQVEVLRGPQNTRYGQSAIAGLINIETNEPTDFYESMIEGSLGQYGHRDLGIMTSGPFSKNANAPQYRFAIYQHNADGFSENKTVNRKDTNGQDELTARGKLRFFPSDNTLIDVTLLHANVDNGYDTWSRDNSFTTLSNKPGKDTQLTNAAAVKVVTEANPNFVFISKTSFANSDMDYKFDGDWIADPARTVGVYDSTQSRKTLGQDIQFKSTDKSKLFNNSTDWLLGANFSRLEENNRRSEPYDYSGYLYGTSSKSEYSHNKFALYTQLDLAMTPKSSLQYGFRVENAQKDFKQNLVIDDAGTITNSSDVYNPNETLWGANLTYSYKYNPTHTAYTGVTRGFKAGGFNTGQPSGTPNSALTFNAETLWNYELGLKSNYKSIGLKTATSVFYMDRETPQFDGSGYDPINQTNWVFFTENLSSAKNYGLEAEFDWQATSQFNFYGSLGLLKTEANGTPLNTNLTVIGREQSHAPNYQFNVGAKYRASNGLYAMADMFGMDSFYFDNVHNAKSQAYQVSNARLGYEAKSYEVYLWVKNLTDERYATRGFFFNHGDGDGKQQYIRLGDPRHFGITARAYF